MGDRRFAKKVFYDEKKNWKMHIAERESDTETLRRAFQCNITSALLYWSLSLRMQINIEADILRRKSDAIEKRQRRKAAEKNENEYDKHLTSTI